MRALERTLSALLLALGLAGCVGLDPVPLEDAELARPSKPLGGQTLAEHARELKRSQDDLARYLKTLDSLQARRDRNGLVLLKETVDEYLGTHVDPLISRDWTSDHPELIGLDLSVRFLSIELLSKLRAPHRAQYMIDDVMHRYAGREDVLVDYPLGKKSTLREALEIVEDQKWRG